MTTDIEQTNSTTQLDKKHASGREFQEQNISFRDNAKRGIKLRSKLNKCGLSVYGDGTVFDDTLAPPYWSRVTKIDLSLVPYGQDFDLFELFPVLSAYVVGGGREKSIHETDVEQAKIKQFFIDRDKREAQAVSQ